MIHLSIISMVILNTYFYFIKSETSDSFVDHFDGHFEYLKTLDFSFKQTGGNLLCTECASAVQEN